MQYGSPENSLGIQYNLQGENTNLSLSSSVFFESLIVASLIAVVTFTKREKISIKYMKENDFGFPLKIP